MIAPDWYWVIFYLFFWLIRINGCVRRGRQPLLRGPEWFFNVRVQPGFYTGAGKAILWRYWMRMLIPFAVDIPVAILIFLSGELQRLNYLILALAGLIHLNHAFSVRLAERQARAFAIPDSGQPVVRMALSLTPRRLRDYTNPAFEWTLGLSSLVAIAWLVRYYLASPDHHNLRLVFGVPAMMIYLQAGMLIAKRAVVAWRSAVPREQAEEHMEVSEQRRRYYLKVCDWSRAGTLGSILFWPLWISAPRLVADRLVGVWLVAWLIWGAVATVWVEIKRKQIVQLALRAQPATLPNLQADADVARWPVCYEPSAPMLIVKGARGYSLNLANSLAQSGAAYVAGFAVLLFVLRMAP